MDSEEKLVFDSQWFQSEASVMHDFLLNFFPKDNSVELVNNTYFPDLPYMQTKIHFPTDRYQIKKVLLTTHSSGNSVLKGPSSRCEGLHIWTQNPHSRLRQLGNKTVARQPIPEVRITQH